MLYSVTFPLDIMLLQRLLMTHEEMHTAMLNYAHKKFDNEQQ